MIKKLLTTILTAATLAACTDSPDPTPPTPAGPSSQDAAYSVSLYLAGDGDASVSRAPAGDYDPGAGVENYIDIDGADYRVALFTADNRWIANLEQNMVVPLDEDFYSSKRYILKSDISTDLAQTINSLGSIKLVVLANWRGNYPTMLESTTIDGLFDAAATIDYSAGLPGPVLAKTDKIAMFGVCQFDGVKLVDQVTFNLGTLHLLRALAKIEVYDGEGTLENMASVALTRYKKAASPMPKGVTHQNQYIKGNYDGDYILYPSLPASWKVFDNESSEPVVLSKAENGHFYIYVPEFNNSDRTLTEQEARIKVTYNGGHEFYIPFRKANKTTKADILRNYWYKFELVRKEGKITATVDLIPYGIVDLSPGFGLNTDEPLIWDYDPFGGNIE